VFYYIKLLQMSWVCNQGRYELLAYDLIGLQYYYLGDLERAQQFHNKMAEGRIEGQNSELRKSGINKILLKMNEGGVNNQKRMRHVQSIEDELKEYNIPNSEDDFELPLEHKYVTRKGNNESPDHNTGKRGAKKYFMVQKPLLNDRNKGRKGAVRPRINMERDYSGPFELSNSEEQDLEMLEESEKKHVYLSHLSPNRLIKNFNSKDVKDVINEYLASGNGKEGNANGIDGKEAEYVKRKLMNLKKNLELALRRMIQLENAAAAMKRTGSKFGSRVESRIGSRVGSIVMGSGVGEVSKIKTLVVKKDSIIVLKSQNESRNGSTIKV